MFKPRQLSSCTFSWIKNELLKTEWLTYFRCHSEFCFIAVVCGLLDQGIHILIYIYWKIWFLSVEGYGSAAVSLKPIQTPEFCEKIILVPLFLCHLIYLLWKYLFLKLIGFVKLGTLAILKKYFLIKLLCSSRKSLNWFAIICHTGLPCFFSRIF